MPDAGFEIGTVVGDRRIDAVIGEGGMGVVYRAWNMRLHRIEAVKVIASALVRDRGFRERFEREMVIAASIEHPHVITLYDSGEGPGGQLYIAMRYIEGTNLAELVARRGRLDPPAGRPPDLAGRLGARRGPRPGPRPPRRQAGEHPDRRPRR